MAFDGPGPRPLEALAGPTVAAIFSPGAPSTSGQVEVGGGGVGEIEGLWGWWGLCSGGRASIGLERGLWWWGWGVSWWVRGSLVVEAGPLVVGNEPLVVGMEPLVWGGRGLWCRGGGLWCWGGRDPSCRCLAQS